jgi:glutathione S-transferase
MLTFYYSPGSSALAAHIALEEAGAEYELRLVALGKQEHLEPDYRSVNPKARIPSLQTPEGILTENPAILAYIALSHPDAGLLPETDFEVAQAYSFNAYIVSTVHVAFAHFQKGSRWSDDPAAIETMRAKVPENLEAEAALIEKHFFKGPWVLGEGYSICDPYCFLVHRWMEKSGADITKFKRLAGHVEAMRARPAVQRVMAVHGLE